uniref:Uncharacterized protein n=1 Tax=Meloidogyne enterolobii TaxID=390850 RepID=A0A6V7U139_MELEN|nr:unnamed protein product [Meloidogyne enterolobii]
MIIFRCWLERLFNCVYGQFNLDRILFNPEMINILFDSEKTISHRFHFESLSMSASNKIFENVLKFVLNHLTISKFFYTSLLYSLDITEQNTNILFNILINEGNKIPKIHLDSNKLARLYDRIMKYITTSRNCSKMVPHIIFYFSISAFSRFKFSESAEKIDKQNYQIANIYNPQMKFALYIEECNDGITYRIHIKRLLILSD